MSVAGWMRYVRGRDEKGGVIDVADPMSARFAHLADAHRGDPAAFARGLLAIEGIFGDDLPRDPRFTEPVLSSLESLLEHGALRTVRDHDARHANPPKP